MPGTPSIPEIGAAPLREGFTTGTAATAAACAALTRLLKGEPAPTSLSVPLPPFSGRDEPAGRLNIPVRSVLRLAPHTAEGEVVKDGGDDPDATHNALLTARVRLTEGDDGPASQNGEPAAILLPGAVPIWLSAGAGIGVVTLPGLPVAVGEPAINPVPRRQLRIALTEVARRCGYTGGLHVTLSIPHGAAIARNTLNPRLGIVGGLSILGTHGTVRPYSHEAWQASIVEGLSVARAVGCPRVALSTGRRSERLLQTLYPDLPPPAFIQAADFAAFSLRAAVDHGFTMLTWGCFFGKLLKLAQGLPYTHAHDAPLDLAALSAWCREAGMTPTETAPLAACLTAGQALELILPHPRAAGVLHALAVRAHEQAERFAPGATVALHLFHINGKELGRV